jgi:filamentous hemagglutinin family protein
MPVSYEQQTFCTAFLINDLSKKEAQMNIASFRSKVVCFVVLLCFPSSQISFAQQIIPDGQTQTRLNIQNKTTNVTTSTVSGPNGFNSFDKFDVYADHTVNLHLPEGTANLINLVHGQASHIDGLLNSFKNGKIGGNVFFANPHGMVVGAQGVMNVGALTAVTPTQKFMDGFFDPAGMPDPGAVQQLLSNNVPISESGLISVQGQVNAIQEISLHARNIVNTGGIAVSPPDAGQGVVFEAMVNIEGLEQGSDIAVRNGEIYITAEKDVINAGGIMSQGADHISGGDIKITAKEDVWMNAGSYISSDGKGMDSSGGTIHVWGGHEVTLDPDSVVSANGGGISGDGGWVEVSAAGNLRLAGGRLRASAIDGKDGAILLDPDQLTIANDLLRDSAGGFGGTGDGITWDAGTLTLLADEQITLEPDVVVSSRQVTPSSGQTLRNAHLNNDSDGDSGHIAIEAPRIELQTGSMLLAQVEDGSGYSAGNIDLTAYDTVDLATPLVHIKNTEAGIHLDQAVLKGGDITLSAMADSSKIFDDTSDEVDFAIEILENVNTIAGVAISNADSTITVGSDSLIQGHNVSMEATAKADAEVKTQSTALGVAYGEANPSAKITLEDRVTITAAEDLSVNAYAHSNVDVGSYTQNLGKSKGAQVDVSLAIGQATIVSESKLAETAQLTAGGDLDFQARMLKKMNTTAAGGAYEDGSVGAAAAISQSDSDVNALFNGQARVRGDINVQAVSTTDENKTYAKSQVGGSNIIVKVLKAGSGVLDKLKTKFGQKEPDPDSRSNSKKDFALSASFAYSEHTNNATARIGDPASSGNTHVDSLTGQIGLNALIKDAMQVRAKTKIDSDKLADVIEGDADLKERSVSASVVVGDFTNNAYSAIEGNAVVNAKKGVNVLSETKIPYAIEWKAIPEVWDMITTDLTDITAIIDKLGDGYLVTSWANAQANGTKTAVGGSVNDVVYRNHSDAFIKEGARVNQDVSFREDVVFDPTTVIDPADSTVRFAADHHWATGDILAYHNGGNDDVQGLADGQTYHVQVVDPTAIKLAASEEALMNEDFLTLDPGVTVDETHSFTDLSVDQTVSVKSSSEIETVNLAGVFDLFGESPETAGVGGAYLGADYHNRVNAVIEDQVMLHADDLSVKADTNNKNVTIAASGGKAEDYAISGSFSLLTIDNATTARIDPGADIRTEDGIVEDSDDANILVDAQDRSQIYNIGGGVAKSENVGVGASVSINEISRDTRAFIGDLVSDPLTAGQMISEGDVRINAYAGGLISAWSLAAAVAKDSSPTDGSQTKEAPKGEGRYGITISGDVSLNTIDDMTEAFVRDAAIEAQDTRLKAETDNDVYGLAGSVAITKSGSSGGQSLGLAGSYSQSTLTNTTRAFVDHSALLLGGDLNVDAHTTGTIKTITAGGAGSDKVGVSGSVSINEITGHTHAFVNDSELITVRDAQLVAEDDTQLWSIAGSLSYGGKAAIGAGVALNTIRQDVASFARGSDMTVTGDIHLNADTDDEIKTVSAAIAGSKGQMAAAAAVSLNEIENSTQAYIEGQLSATGITVGGISAINAQDASDILSIAGNIGASTGGAGFGASISENHIQNQVKAYLRDTRFAVSGTSLEDAFSLEASSVPVIQSVSAGGVGAQKVAAGGSVSLNEIKSATESFIYGAELKTQKNVVLDASENALIGSIAGTISGAGKASFGIALATNELGSSVSSNTVRAFIEDALVVSEQGTVTLRARSDSIIKSITGAGSGAGKLSANGSVSTNTVYSAIESYIRGVKDTTGSQKVSAYQDVSLSATDHSSISVIAGSIAGAGTAAAGAAVATADIGDASARNKVRAYIDHSDVVSETGDVQLKALSDAVIFNITAGMAAAAYSLQGSVGVNNIYNDVSSWIQDSSVVNAQDNVVLTAGSGSRTSIARGALQYENDLTLTSSFSGSEGSESESRAITSVQSVAGSISVGGTAGAGAAVATNDISNHFDSGITGSTVIAEEGDVVLHSRSNAGIETVSGALAATGSLSVVGAVSLNHITNQIQTQITDSTVVSRNSVDQISGLTIPGISAVAEDTSNISSISGQISVGGSGALGGSAAYNEISNTITSMIGQGSHVQTQGNVAVMALSEATIESVAAGGSFAGTAGVAGSVSINRIENDTAALLEGTPGQKTTVQADDNVYILARSDNTINNYGGAIGAGTVGMAGAVVVNTVKNTTRAYTEHAKINARATGGAIGVTAWDVNGEETVEDIRGLFVIADARENIEVYSGSLGAGAVGLSGQASVSKVEDMTEAYIAASHVNDPVDQDGSVRVLARQNTAFEIWAGSGAIGGVAIGAAVDRTSVRNTTKAYISDRDDQTAPNAVSPSLVRARNVMVQAQSEETIVTSIAGASLAGGLAVSGSVSVVDINNTNQALVLGSDIFASEDVLVFSQDNAAIDTLVVVVSGSMSGAAGGSLAINTIGNNTSAKLIGARVNTPGQTAIMADSKEYITTLVGTGSVGLGIGLAGAVSVNTIESTTEAVIVSGQRGSEINQHQDYQPGGVYAPGTTQTTLIKADDMAYIKGTGGAVGVGGAGVGATIDVGTIQNRTMASVGKGTKIYSRGNVDILAFSDRQIQSRTAALGGGLLGLSGAISVVSLGSGLDDDGAGEFSGDLRNQVRGDSDTPDITVDTDDDTAVKAKADVDTMASPDINGLLSTEVDTSAKLTAAMVEDALDSADRAHIVSGNDINILSVNEYDVDVDAGQISAGAVGLGASIATVSVNNKTESMVGKYNDLEAEGAVLISAVDRPKPNGGASLVKIYSGNVGIVGAGGGWADITVNNQTQAHLDDDTVINRAKSVTLSADQSVRAQAEAIGWAGGLAAAGVLEADVTIGGTVAAFTGATRIGQSSEAGQQVGLLTLRAMGDHQAHAKARSTAGGVAAGSGSDADSSVGPRIMAFIGDGAKVQVKETDLFDLPIMPGLEPDFMAELDGGIISPLIKDAFAQKDISISDDAQVSVIDEGQKWQVTDGGQIFVIQREGLAFHVRQNGDVNVEALAQIVSRSQADGINAGGVAVGVSDAMAKADPVIQTYIGQATTITAERNVALLSTIRTEVDSNAMASAGALIGVAGSDVSAYASPEAETFIGLQSEIDAGNFITIKTLSTNDIDASASGKIGGVAAFGSNTARAVTGSRTGSFIDRSVSMEARQVQVKADAVNDTFSKAVAGAGGGIAGVTAKAVTDQSNETKAYINGNPSGRGDLISASENVLVEATEESVFNARVDSSAAGLVGLSGGNAYNTIHSVVEAFTGSEANVEAGRDILIKAVNRTSKNSSKNINLRVGSGGVFGGAAGESHSAINNVTKAYTAGNLSDHSDNAITAGRDITISSANDVFAYDKAKLSAGGAVSGAMAESGFDLDPYADYGVNLNADTSVGPYSRLAAGNDIHVASKTDAAVEAITYTRTWGLASMGDGKAVVELRSSNATDVAESSSLYAGRDVHISAGMDEDYLQNILYARAEARSYVSGGIPISSVGGHAYLVDGNQVAVQKDASVTAERDIALGSYRGRTFVQGYAKAKKRSYAFFGIPITVYSNGSRVSSFNGFHTVTVNGYVESGLQHLKTLTIKADPDTWGINGINGNMDYTLETVNRKQYVTEKREQVEDEMQACQDGSCKQLALQLQLDRYPDPEDISPDETFDRVTVPDTKTGSGEIRIQGVLDGDGMLKAPGQDFRIQIENESLAHLEINDLEIPRDSRGRILLNGREINPDAYPDLVNLPEEALPEINIFNAYIQDLDDDPVSDIEVLGDIVNLADFSTVNIKNKSGSIETYGNIIAETVNIRAAGDFSHNYTAGLYQTNGASGQQPLIAGKNINISAEIIDITGTVQSGIAHRFIVIPEDFDPYGTRDSQGNVPWVTRIEGRDDVINLYEDEADLWATQALWDEENRRIRIDPVRITGGNIELYGNIRHSTGLGELKVIDGYGSIEVVNHSDYALEVNRLDTGDAMHGAIRVIDTLKQNPAPIDPERCEPLVSEYTRDANGIIHLTESYMYLEKLADEDYAVEETEPMDYPEPGPARQTAYMPLEGSEAVKITFDGDDLPGVLSILNSGDSDVFINRSLENQQGLVSVVNQGRNIYALNDTAVLYGRDITLSALQGGIGDIIQPVQIDTQGGMMNAAANGLVHIQEIAGGLDLGTVVTNGDVRLRAAGAITDQVSDQFSVSGRNIMIEAGLSGSGGIARFDNELTLDGHGILRAIAQDDVYIAEIDGDIFVDQVISRDGDVRLAALNGSIYDANVLEAKTEEELAQMLLKKDTLELRDQDTKEQMEPVASEMQQDLEQDKNQYVEDKTAKYRSDHVLPDEEIVYLKEQQKATYDQQYRDDNGTPEDPSDDSYYEGYDPDWECVLTQEDIDAKAGRIAYQKNQEYQDAHYVGDNGTPDDPSDDYDNTYDPDWEYSVKTSDLYDTDYDPDYIYVLTAEEEQRFVEGNWESAEELVNAKNIDTLSEEGETPEWFEASNIVGHNVTLAAKSSVGQTVPPEEINKQDPLTLQERIMVAGARRDDVTDLQDRIVIHRLDDIDIQATGAVAIEATEDIYVGAKGDFHVDQILSTAGNVKVEGNGGIQNNHPGQDGPNIVADNFQIELPQGAIGQLTKPLVMDLREGGLLSAQAYGNISLKELEGGLTADEILSQTGSLQVEVQDGDAKFQKLTAPGDIQIIVNNGSLVVDSVDPANIDLAVSGIGNGISVGTVTVSQGVKLSGDYVDIQSLRQTAGVRDQLRFQVKGHGNQLSRYVKLRIDSGNPVIFDMLMSEEAYIDAGVDRITFLNTWIGQKAEFNNHFYNVIVDNVNKTLFDCAAQLYAKDLPFNLELSGIRKPLTNAIVVHYNGYDYLVNQYSSENSATRRIEKFLFTSGNSRSELADETLQKTQTVNLYWTPMLYHELDEDERFIYEQIDGNLEDFYDSLDEETGPVEEENIEDLLTRNDADRDTVTSGEAI